MQSDHEHVVFETHARSLLKGATAKLIEVAVDFGVLYFVFGQPEKDLGLALGLEIFCYICGFFNERIWNKVQWGRKVVDKICGTAKSATAQDTS